MARYACSAQITFVVLAIATPSLGGCEDSDHRADIVVYGDHVPAYTNSGDPFPNPFTAQATSGDPVTTTVMKEIPGLRHPRGTASWGVEAWATYVFLGNYDHEGGGVFQNIEDQRIHIELNLGFLLTPLSGAIKNGIAKELTSILANG